MTMTRKLSTLAVATALAAFGFTALAGQDFGKDDASPLHKLMEKVQVQNATILKGVRNPVQFKKSQEDVVKAAEELGKLGKEAKDFTEPAKAQKQRWQKGMPDTITYDMWLDDSDLMRRIEFDLGAMMGQQGSGGAGGMVMTMNDWGKPVTVKAPPAKDLVEMPGGASQG